MIINGLRMRYVNGFGYRQVLPAPEADIPGRLQRAEQVFAQKIWREQLRDWDENCKPSAIAKHRELQAVDPDALSDTELVAYLTRCRDHHSAMLAQHMRFTAGAVLPTGDFLAHVGDWTGIAASDLLGLMRGSAEVSAGGSDEMTRLKKAFADDPSCREVLSFDGEPEQVLARLRSLDGEAGAAVSGYLDLVGNRIITASTSPSRQRSNCRTHSSELCALPSREKLRPRTSMRALPKFAPGFRGAPGRVRPTARRGPPHLPTPRRTWSLQRYLGRWSHAARAP
jgi:hypothetical protein